MKEQCCEINKWLVLIVSFHFSKTQFDKQMLVLRNVGYAAAWLALCLLAANRQQEPTNFKFINALLSSFAAKDWRNANGHVAAAT